MMRLTSLICVPALCLGLALPVAAKPLIIEGRASQALHCAAVLYMVSEELYRSGYVNRGDYDTAQQAAIRMLAHVPGTEKQKIDAMGQKFERLFRSRNLEQLMTEFDNSADWCRQEFL